MERTIHFFTASYELETRLNNADLHIEDADEMVETLSNIYENYLMNNIELRNRLVSFLFSNILKVITNFF